MPPRWADLFYGCHSEGVTDSSVIDVGLDDVSSADHKIGDVGSLAEEAC